LNRFADDVKPADFEIAADDVYNVDIMVTTGAGRLQEAEIRTTGWRDVCLACVSNRPPVFRRNLLCKYLLKSKSSRTVYAEISSRYPTMPFSARTLDSPNTRLAIKVCRQCA
jgi:hypothetical protein